MELIALLEKHQALSGWAQTIGSFIALFIAIWLPYRQAKKLERKEANAQKQEVVDHVEKLYALGVTIHSMLRRLIDIGHDKSIEDTIEEWNEVFSKDSLRALVHSLNQWPMHELPSASFVVIGLEMREACNAGAENIHRYISGMHNRNSMEVGYAAGNVNVALVTILDHLELLKGVRDELLSS